MARVPWLEVVRPEPRSSGSDYLNQPASPMLNGELRQQRWRVLSLTSIGMFMGTLDGTIVAVALPVLSPALRLTYSEALWVQAAYLLAVSVFLIPLGRVADRHGRMRLYLIGIAIFGVFSLACSLATNGILLIVARCLQGLGASFTAATSPALVTEAFPPEQRGRGLGLNASAGFLGLMAGPPLGGFIVTHADWRWIFLINVPISILTLANGWLLMRTQKREQEEAAGRSHPGVAGHGPVRAEGIHIRDIMDWPGIALLSTSLVALVVPLTFVPFWGWLSAPTLGLLAASVVLLTAFCIVEGRVANPVLDLRLVRRNRAFAAGNLAALLNFAASYGVTVFTAVFLEVAQGSSAQRAGLLLLIQPVFMAGLSPVFGFVSDRIGSRIPATGGMLVAAAGMVQLGCLPASSPAWRILLALGTVGLGMAAFGSPNTSAVMGSVERSQLSLAAGFLGTVRTVGQSVSVALLGAITASGLGPTGGRVLFLGEEASQQAVQSFAAGYRTAMFLSAGIAVAAAVVSLVRGPRQTGGDNSAG